MARKITDDAEAPAAAGHNGPTEETFLKHVRTIIAANLKVEEAKAARNAVRKLAKAEGIELRKLDAIVTMADWEPGEVRDHFSTLQRYAVWMGLPVGTQVDLFEGVPEIAKQGLDWEAKGLLAATTGKGAHGKPPSECPPDQIDNWMKGWHRGQEKNAPAKLEKAA